MAAEEKAVIFNDGKFQGIGQNGLVVPYGKLYFYESVSGNAVDTFTTSTMETKNTFPIVLSASGKADVFVGDGQFDVSLLDKNGVNVWTINNYIPAGGEGALVQTYTETTREDATGIIGTSWTLDEVPTTGVTVHKNGLILNEDEYSLSGKTITFVTPLIVTDEMVAEFGIIVLGTNKALLYSIDVMVDILILDVASIVSVNVEGYNASNDGGGGNFNWDATIDKSTANAGTIIDPSVSLALQGTGSGLGCWVRQDEFVTLEMFGIVSPSYMKDSNWIYDSTIDKATANLGTIVDPSVALTAQGTGVGTGCLVRQYNGAVNVKWFGAIGDGVVDDTAVFTAVAALTSTAIVPFTADSYLISSSLVNTATTFIFYGASTQVTGTVTLQQLKALFTNNGYLNGIPVADELRDKKIGIISGTLRQNATTRSQWDWIKDSGHEPIGFDDSVPATATGETLQVNFDKTYTKVLAVLCTPDEVYSSALGMSIGASVGAEWLSIKASVDLTLGALINYNGATWDIAYATAQGGSGDHSINITNISMSGANVTIDHSWLSGADVSLTAFTDGGVVIPYIPVIKAISSTQLVINFIDYTGAFVLVPDTSMSFILSKNYSGVIKLDGTDVNNTLDLDLGNIWINGIMQF